MAQTIQRSFTGGEIAPSLRSRADLVKYSSGLALCENMFVRSQGGVYSRPGTKFIGEIGQSDKRARLIPFSFNTEQTYVLVFEHLTMRVIKDGGFVLDGAGPSLYEIATPYLESELSRLSFTQDADVMTIVHPNYDPRDLSRTADDEWSLDVIDFDPPISPPSFTSDSVATITAITQASQAQVTTSAPHGLSNDDVVFIESVSGMIELNDRGFEIFVDSTTTFILKGEDSTAHIAYTSGGTATSGGLVAYGNGAGDFDKTYSYVITAVSADGESVASSSKSITTPSLSVTAGVRISWDAVNNASYYRVYKDPSNGTGIYGWIGDSETTQFDDYNIAPITSDAPPQDRAPFESLAASITAVTKANPTVVTATAHGFSTGQNVSMSSVGGMTELNGNTYVITVIDVDSFSLNNTDSSAYTTYTSGGTATRTNNKPATVAYYQQRRVFANTNEEPQTVFTTQTGVYDSLRSSIPARADDAVTFTIKGRQVNEIRHAIDVDGLVLLTSGAEWRVTEGQDQVLTPSTVGARIQSYYGTSWVPPQIVGDTVIFIQEKGSRVRDIKYEFVDDKYSGNDLSIMAEHLFEGYEIEEMTFSQEPYSIVWMVRNDGKVLAMTYQREHQVGGWHQHDFGGVVESITSISEGQRDALYMVVKRTIDGSTVRCVERMEQRYTSAPADVWCVDSGLQYDGAAATVISGLDHLEGEAVSVVADGNEVKNLTVASGAITLPRAASKVTVGLAYTPAIELLDIDLSSTNETLKGKEVSVSRVILEVEKSRGGWVGPKKDDGSTGTMLEIKPRFDTDNYDAIALKTFKQEIYIEPQWSKGGGIRIEQRAPFPLAILSVIPEVDVS